jgi:chromosomal replication initiator protein
MMRRDPSLRNVTYVSSELFTNELIDAIMNKSTQSFRSKYRSMDILLIDDIHFIAGKNSTQDEFFHTFNDLHNLHRQVVLSSDRQPKDIPLLEERLISRFQWGLVTDIQAPDLETRIAILQKKATQEGLGDTPREVFHFIATLITANIRELEGALIRVRAYASLVGKPITLTLVEEALKVLIGQAQSRQITAESVQKTVAKHYDLRMADLKGRNRQRAVAFPRQIAMYLCRKLVPGIALKGIGEAFGGKDHTTVIHACKRIEREMTANHALVGVLDYLESEVRNS